MRVRSSRCRHVLRILNFSLSLLDLCLRVRYQTFRHIKDVSVSPLLILVIEYHFGVATYICTCVNRVKLHFEEILLGLQLLELFNQNVLLRLEVVDLTLTVRHLDLAFRVRYFKVREFLFHIHVY